MATSKIISVPRLKQMAVAVATLMKDEQDYDTKLCDSVASLRDQLNDHEWRGALETWLDFPYLNLDDIDNENVTCDWDQDALYQLMSWAFFKISTEEINKSRAFRSSSRRRATAHDIFRGEVEASNKQSSFF